MTRKEMVDYILTTDCKLHDYSYMELNDQMEDLERMTDAELDYECEAAHYEAMTPPAPADVDPLNYNHIDI